MSKIITFFVKNNDFSEYSNRCRRKIFEGPGVANRINSQSIHEHNYVQEHMEGIDEELLGSRETEFFKESPKKIVNKVESPDLRMMFSMNPYQGCEHGCVYCYARNAHNYWGFSAGLDFETKIIVNPKRRNYWRNS